MPIAIYLIDGDHSFRNALTRWLRSAGFLVMAYRSGTEFLKERPGNDDQACIVVEPQTSGMDGFELQERLSRLGSTVPIIFLTGSGTIEMGVRALKAGADDFFTKRVALDRLVGAINLAVHSAKHAQPEHHAVAVESGRRRRRPA